MNRTVKPSSKLRNVFLTAALIGTACTLGIPRARAQSTSHFAPPATIHERFATFLSGDGFKSMLLLENLRQDTPITVSSSLILASGEIPLESLSVPAHSTSTVDISAFLQAHGYHDKRGTVSVRFTFGSYGPLTAVVESADEVHHVYLNSFAQSPEEYWSGTAFDAVVWAPNQGTRGSFPLPTPPRNSASCTSRSW